MKKTNTIPAIDTDRLSEPRKLFAGSLFGNTSRKCPTLVLKRDPLGLTVKNLDRSRLERDFLSFPCYCFPDKKRNAGGHFAAELSHNYPTLLDSNLSAQSIPLPSLDLCGRSRHLL